MEKPVKQKKQRESQLQKELAFLFGRELIVLSECISIDDMLSEANLVAEGAKKLLQHKGQPEAQRGIVQSMNFKAALALCRWIKEPSMMATKEELPVHTIPDGAV